MGRNVVRLNNHIIDSIKDARKTLGALVTLSTSLAPRLPPTQIDPNQIREAIVDIAAHARDAMSPGGRFMIETQSVVLHEHHSEIRRKYVLLSLSHTARLAPFPDLLTTYTFVKQSGGHVTIENRRRLVWWNFPIALSGNFHCSSSGDEVNRLS
jgi:hypothetical protein